MKAIVLPSLVIIAGVVSSCEAPRNAAAPAPEYTGTIVQSEGDTITVLIGDQLATIQLEGFVTEGRDVAGAVNRSPAHAAVAAER